MPTTRSRGRTRRLMALTAALALFAAGCAGAAAGGGDRLVVVATTTQAADFVRNVGGDRVTVDGLLAPNSDPHDYEVRPDDVKALTRAQLIVRSGGDVDDWLKGAIESAGSKAPVLTLSDRVAPGNRDPHWWQDPRLVVKAVKAIRATLEKADPAGRATYAKNAEAYEARLRALDAAVERCVHGIPADQRKLVTTHDALAYYARRYGFEVIGTVIPALTTQAQASAGDVARLVDTIRREHVRAIFAESSVNPKVERAVAGETGAKIGAPLWADSLGPPHSSGATYADSIRANTTVIVDGLTGGERKCTLPR